MTEIISKKKKKLFLITEGCYLSVIFFNECLQIKNTFQTNYDLVFPLSRAEIKSSFLKDFDDVDFSCIELKDNRIPINLLYLDAFSNEKIQLQSLVLLLVLLKHLKCCKSGYDRNNCTF